MSTRNEAVAELKRFAHGVKAMLALADELENAASLERLTKEARMRLDAVLKEERDVGAALDQRRKELAEIDAKIAARQDAFKGALKLAEAEQAALETMKEAKRRAEQTVAVAEQRVAMIDARNREDEAKAKKQLDELNVRCVNEERRLKEINERLKSSLVKHDEIEKALKRLRERI